MVGVFLFFLILLVGSSMGYLSNDVKVHNHHFNRISRNNERHRPLRNIMGKLIDTETNTIYSIDGQKQQGTSVASLSMDPSTKFSEDLACLEACYKCVEDYPLVTVRIFIDFIYKYYSFSLSSARKKQPIIVVQCVIVLTVVLKCQSTR